MTRKRRALCGALPANFVFLKESQKLFAIFVIIRMLQKRLARARTEMAAYPEYEYVVVNDDVERAVEVLCAIITAERSKSRRFTPAPDMAPGR